MDKLVDLVRSGFFWGIWMMLLAVLWLLEKMGLQGFSLITTYWPLILVGIGLLMIKSSGNGSGNRPAIFMIGMGVLLLLSNLNFFGFNLSGFIWPLMLFAIGVVMLMKSQASIFTGSHHKKSKIRVSGILGGGDYVYQQSELDGGNVTYVMAGGKINFKDADMLENKMELNIFLLMGGLEIIVPDSWSLDIQIDNFLGGVNDQTKTSENKSIHMKKTLVIKGLAIMSGVDISNG